MRVLGQAHTSLVAGRAKDSSLGQAYARLRNSWLSVSRARIEACGSCAWFAATLHHGGEEDYLTGEEVMRRQPLPLAELGPRAI